MTWREDLRRVRFGNGQNLIGASFRGVPFFVESADRTGGRRAVVHEFPLRDKPYVEDLGERAHSFRLDGYVIGDDYMSQRDALLVALDRTAGPGELVHPNYGRLVAICVGNTVREARDIGGIAMLSLEFAEAPDQATGPTQVVDGAGRVALSADAAIVATEAEFVERYDIAGLPAFALGSAETALAGMAAGLSARLAPLAGVAQEMAELTGRMALLTAQASSLVRQPASVLGELRGSFAGLVNTTAAAPGAVMRAFADAYGSELGPAVVPLTATRTRELANQAALTGALRSILAIEAARLAPLVPYASVEEATAARDQVAAMLEEQAAAAGDTAYPALVNLRSEVLRSVPGGTAFASIVTVTRPVPIPSLLLAYQLYGSVDRELDIVARNKTPHPGFVVGDLQVLSDD